MINWGKFAGWTGITITYLVYSVAIYFFVYRLGWRWFWTSEKWSAAIILYPTMDISVRIFMGIWCHIYCCTTDPGIIQRPGERMEVTSCCFNDSICKKCDYSRPARTHHCSTCNACIYQMDHHCPWVNNCVGLGNQKAFLLFLAYTSSAAIECLGLAGLRLVTCPNVYNSLMVLGLRFVVGESHIAKVLAQSGNENFTFDETCDFKIDYAAAGIIAIICAAIFVVFIAFIATDQIQSIVRNQTFVESLKAGCAKPPDTYTPAEIGIRLQEVMGSNPSLNWLLPMRSTSWRTSLVIKPDNPVRGS
jgi:hypothetical protein